MGGLIVPLPMLVNAKIDASAALGKCPCQSCFIRSYSLPGLWMLYRKSCINKFTCSDLSFTHGYMISQKLLALYKN